MTLNYKRSKKTGPGPIVRHGWSKPPEDLVKLNVDAAFDVNTGSGVLVLLFVTTVAMLFHVVDGLSSL